MDKNHTPLKEKKSASIHPVNYYKVLPDPLKEQQEQIINHPPHYARCSVEVIDIIDLVLEHTGGSFTIGNAVKYICRHTSKGSPILDLEKAVWYLQREIKQLEKPTTTATDIQGDDSVR